MCKAAEQNPAPSVAFQRAGGGAGHLEPVRLGHMKYKDAAGLVGPLLVDASKKVVTSQDERLERTKQLKAPALCPLAKLKTDEPQLGKLVEEAKDAATRRLLDRPEDLEGLLARASELPDTMPLVQEFQDLVGTIHDGLADVLGKLKTRDLLPKEPLFHEATTQSLQLVIDRLKAKASVDTPEELSRCRSVEDSARAEYERYSKQLDEDGGDDEKFCDASEDTLEDEDAPMVDAATMLRCTNDLETALGRSTSTCGSTSKLRRGSSSRTPAATSRSICCASTSSSSKRRWLEVSGRRLHSFISGSRARRSCRRRRRRRGKRC